MRHGCRNRQVSAAQYTHTRIRVQLRWPQSIVPCTYTGWPGIGFNCAISLALKRNATQRPSRGRLRARKLLMPCPEMVKTVPAVDQMMRIARSLSWPGVVQGCCVRNTHRSILDCQITVSVANSVQVNRANFMRGERC